ncbi:hypothetical protein K431DRAFT_346814 [Polychaeton citri CBS 116435]|uniref:Yeast cell wall synthesis Kre9/Knh1-like N-terminal domain-containing protein n=1 Tax=Polychaeton citri CBS 116435 TaxID=1314669 RepID=A0A9P4UPM5_9PEZI|nr:hypothetical protein K431DRAFT_346814 [Polychaeton citri CBS 116435]
MSSSGFSILSLFTAGLAIFGPVTFAWTQPQGDSPEGNPIYTPGLHEVVPAGKSYTITWKPTTDANVDLVLLKGPSSNAVPQYAIAEKVANTGSYTWTPSTDLVPTGDEGYGIELIDTSTGKYQYSTQFGISNKVSPAEYSDSSASASSSAVVASATSSAAPSSTVISSTYSSVPTSAVSSAASTTSAAGYSSAIVAASSTFKSSYVVPSGVARPTGNYGNSTSTGPSSPAFTGGATSTTYSIFGAAVAAGLAVFMM